MRSISPQDPAAAAAVSLAVRLLTPRRMVDLHLHTTASDGRCTPEDLVQRCAAAGITTLSVTDHDTMAGVEAAVRAATRLGLTVVPGVELTAVHAGRDVHVLAYFLPQLTADLDRLLSAQRRLRIERALEIAERLAWRGAPIDVTALLAAAPGTSIARPQIARALVASGHATSIADAFARFIGEDSPAYVPHRGAPPERVVELVLAAGGLPALAHPGYRPRDEIIPVLVGAGLPAIEVYHSSHDPAATAHYLAVAARYGLAPTGGSDYHGPGTRREEYFGRVGLPPEQFEALVAAAGHGCGARAVDA